MIKLLANKRNDSIFDWMYLLAEEVLAEFLMSARKSGRKSSVEGLFEEEEDVEEYNER